MTSFHIYKEQSVHKRKENTHLQLTTPKIAHLGINLAIKPYMKENFESFLKDLK